MTETRLLRSALYVPASRPGAMDKARDLPADAVILDLEDAVIPTQKGAAREALVSALGQGGYGRRLRVVRVNDLGSEWGAGDVEALSAAPPDAVLLPKVAGPAEVAALVRAMDAHASLSSVPVWAMIETPAGVQNVAGIAAAPRVGGLVMGTNDLAADLHCQPGPDRAPLQFALQACLLAARAAGIPCLDGVYNAPRDPDGLRAECVQGRALGMDGKTVIHPAQIEVANDVFSPTAAEVDLARRRIAAFRAAEGRGQGVAVLDGSIVENLHITAAEAVLSRARAVEEANA